VLLSSAGVAAAVYLYDALRAGGPNARALPGRRTL